MASLILLWRMTAAYGGGGIVKGSIWRRRRHQRACTSMALAREQQHRKAASVA